MGLLLASLAGGPVAGLLIRRYRLQAQPDDRFDVGVTAEAEDRPEIDYTSFLQAILAIHLAGVLGILAHDTLKSIGIQHAAFSSLPYGGYTAHGYRAAHGTIGVWPSRTAALALSLRFRLACFWQCRS